MKHLAVSLLATQATNGLENTREMCHCRGNLQPPTCLEFFFLLFLGGVGGFGGVSPPKALVKPALGATITRSSSHRVELGPLQSKSLVTATGFGFDVLQASREKSHFSAPESQQRTSRCPSPGHGQTFNTAPIFLGC